VIATAQPRIAVWSREQRIDLRPYEKSDQRAWVSFIGNCQHALDQAGVLRRFERSEAEE